MMEKPKKWSEQDPNPKTSSYIKKLVQQTESDIPVEEKEAVIRELNRLFPKDDSRIGFGTAGLRSAMKPGPLGMNDLVIVQTAQGLAKYIQEAHEENNNTTDNKLSTNKKKITAVVGYDHRENPEFMLSSLSFALLTALVFEEAGMGCLLYDGYVHTPLVPYGVSELQASVGIMITASHNPKEDAGYKVYWGDGCQIRPPLDTGIATSILQQLEPWTDYGAKLTARRKTFAGDACLGLSDPNTTKTMMDSYFLAIRNTSGLVTGQSQKLSTASSSSVDSWVPPKIAYTAMHGIGHDVAVRSFDTFGLPPFLAVPEQCKPDPTFPTVSFPNPEEKGALDIAMAFANTNKCDLVLANDPDADRMAVAERDRQTGEWTVFTGDQIGTMLGHWLWTSVGKDCGKPVAMCASTVSSKMLAAIAKAEGFHFEDTLTGFKWIGTRAAELSKKEGYMSLLAYEEAIGFACGEVVFDKDGITAIGVMAELAYNVYHRGSNLAGHMQSLYDKYGEFVSHNGYYFCHDPAIVQRIIADMRNGGKYMESLGNGEYKIDSIRDLGEPGYDSLARDKRPTLPTSASSPMITLRFSNGCVAQFRGSGTEPKFKYYIEMQGKPGVSRAQVTEVLAKMCDTVLEELLHPSKHGLVDPTDK